MDTRHRTPAGALVAQCSDEDSCTVFNCEICLREIPADASSQSYTQDYVHHFCGLECLEVWRKRAGLPLPARPAPRSDRLK